MAGKHDTTKPSWLSGLVTRRGSGKNKKSEDNTDEKGSVFKFKRQKKSPAQESTIEFKPLEVDLNKLEALRLSEGWLEPEPRKSEHKAGHQQTSTSAQAPENSITPIADLYASKSALNLLDFDQVRRSSSQNRGTNGVRPGSILNDQGSTYTRPHADVATIRLVPSTGSVLDRGRPVEPKHFVTEPVKEIKQSRQEQRPQTSASAAASRDFRRKPVQYSSGNDTVAVKQNTFTQTRTEDEYDPFNSNNRHSMYAGATPSTKDVETRTRPALAPRSVSATPLDRIQAWQKTVTSAPNSGASVVSRLSSVRSLAPTAPAQTAAPVRKISPRGVAGNRLAWIKELEEKNSSSTSRDMGVLKKQQGSVSDKLAMFEKHGQSTPSVGRMPPLTRSNSTTSRLSSVGLESTFSAGNNTATPRTSIDSVRSSHRASSVMNYYDASFREKMETMVSGYAPDKDKTDGPKKQKVTAQFVSVEPAKKGAETQSRPTQVDPPSAEPGRDSDEESDKEARQELLKEIQDRSPAKKVEKEFERELQKELEENAKDAEKQGETEIEEEAEVGIATQVEMKAEMQPAKEIHMETEAQKDSDNTSEIPQASNVAQEVESSKELEGIPQVAAPLAEAEISREPESTSEAQVSSKADIPQATQETEELQKPELAAQA